MLTTIISTQSASESLRCDAYAVLPVSYAERIIYALSLSGTQGQVMAARAMLNSKHRPTIQIDGEYHRMENDQKYEIKINKLPKYRMANMVIRSRSESLCIGPKVDSIGDYLLGAHIDSPLLPHWIPWIVGKLAEGNQVRELRCYGDLEAYICSCKSRAVDAIVAQGIQFGHLKIAAPRLAIVGA